MLQKKILELKDGHILEGNQRVVISINYYVLISFFILILI